MNLGDPELEVLDPTPNVHALFIHFDKLFFWTKLASRAVVRWSKRMYSCAGICSKTTQQVLVIIMLLVIISIGLVASAITRAVPAVPSHRVQTRLDQRLTTRYDRGGLCDIALSEPLLKLRPRKDLVETLLHEMIHAYLFVTSRNQDRDGHGPIFQGHMHRINKSAGLNISIYHDFHDEVELYQTHWWRCNGPCQTRRPHFGIVRRFMNKPPGPTDYWFARHSKNCGGTFIKFKEPEKKGKKTAAPKSNGDITKFINNPKTINNNVIQNDPPRSVLKDSNSIPVKTKSNGGSTLVITKKDPIFNPKAVNKPQVIFSGKGHSIDGGRKRSDSIDVVETVRNIWANKQLPTSPDIALNKNKATGIINATLKSTPNYKKHKTDDPIDSPPSKVKKIDDYFKATTKTMLKDLYGQDFHIIQSDKDQKIAAVAVKSESKITSSMSGTNDSEKKTSSSVNLVVCPVCSAKISSQDINRHLDECLNKDVIETLSKDGEILISQSTTTLNTTANINLLKDFNERIKNVKIPKQFSPPVNQINTIERVNSDIIKIEKEIKSEADEDFDSNDVNRNKEIVKKINYDRHVQKSEKLVPKKENVNNVYFGHLPSFLDDVACKIENPGIKIEPGTSQDAVEFVGRMCACCGNQISKPIEEHLEECLAFFTNNTTIPEEGASTSFANETIMIDDDDDIFDESQTLNATGTKSPCPCCLQMIEQADMNSHLDLCLS